MKKITPFVLALCLSLGLSTFSANADVLPHASELYAAEQTTYTRFTADTKAKDSENTSKDNADKETDTEVPETDLEPSLLETDIVSTDDVLMFSTAGIVMDADTGDVLYYKNPDQVLYPASLTKIMTTLIALDNCSMDETVSVSETALDVPWDSTRLGVLEGQEITMEEALYAVMVTSANDITNAVAEHISGSQKDFAALMNEYVSDLGLENTHFTNANGLHDDDHYSTARDLALICKEALTHDAFKAMASAKVYTYTSEILREEEELKKIKEENDGEVPPYVLYSHHKMLNGVYEYEFATGGKTGYTPEARITLATTAEKDGKNLICIMLDCLGQHNNVYKDYVYMDTEAALNYCFENYDQIVAAIRSEEEATKAAEAESAQTESIAETIESKLPESETASADSTSTDNKDSNNFVNKIAKFLDLSDADKSTGEKAIVIGILIVCIILLMLIIRQLVKVLKRKYRRIRYNKLKKQRLAENALETANPEDTESQAENNDSAAQP